MVYISKIYSITYLPSLIIPLGSLAVMDSDRDLLRARLPEEPSDEVPQEFALHRRSLKKEKRWVRDVQNRILKSNWI